MSQDSGIEDQGCGKAERAMGLGTGFEVSGFGFKDFAGLVQLRRECPEHIDMG